ncbi:MAG: phosphohistidine phosphatase SixA [Candidatus Hydrogenedentes bacterium]|nr:phosphohistidine phosphatase SixA [Candidatus Hydrogenedentota bacterium]
MNLYLIQHGEAVEKDINPERPLTDVGRAAVERVAAHAQRCGVRVPEVWHSGKTRAAETAAIVARRLALGAPCTQHPGLGPKDSPEEVCAQLRRRKEDLAIAGHLPHLARVVGCLLTGDPSAEPVAFLRGGIVALERGEEGTWRVAWALPPFLAPVVHDEV